MLVGGALALSWTGCSGDPGEPTWHGTVHHDGAAVEVRNPAAPAFGADAASAETLWTAPDPSEDAADRDWSQPMRVALGAGEVYVLDPMAHRVHVLSREGRALRHVGREGKGPGELQSPFGVAFVNGMLAVGDAGAVDLFSPTGEPSGSFLLGTPAFSLAGLESGEVLVTTARGEQKRYPVQGGASPVALPGFPERNKQAQFACSRVSSAGARILRLDCATPVFQVISREGKVLRTVRIPREPAQATSAEIDRYRRSLASDAAQTGMQPAAVKSLVDNLLKGANPKRTMQGIRYDAAARLYAMWEQQPKEFGNGPARLHLFGEEGAFLVTVPFAEPWVDFAIDGLTVYALAEDDDTGLVRLAAYRLNLAPEVGRFAAAPLEAGGS
jgi:hypothetical protein